MIITSQTPEVGKYTIRDCAGSLIPLVQAFNTETEEITIVLRGVNQAVKNPPGVVVVPIPSEEAGTYRFAPLTLSFKLTGAFAEFDGQIVPPGKGVHPAFLQSAPQPEPAELKIEQGGSVEIDEALDITPTETETV
jgi:hypothetical protein